MPRALRPWAEMVSGYSVLRYARNSSSTNRYMNVASPLSSPMNPSMVQAM